MRGRELELVVSIALVAALTSCSYSPFIVFSNPTGARLELQVDFDDPHCPPPSLVFMPSSHAKRRWRSRETRPVPPEAVQHETGPCRLSVIIPADTALEAQIEAYYFWDGDQERNLASLARVSLEGSLGSITLTGPLLAERFEQNGIRYFVWVYGNSSVAALQGIAETPQDFVSIDRGPHSGGMPCRRVGPRQRCRWPLHGDPLDGCSSMAPGIPINSGRA